MISIHAPREGSDKFGFYFVFAVIPFQSTLPVRGATLAVLYSNNRRKISIHAPREGSDVDVGYNGIASGDFNPRSP